MQITAKKLLSLSLLILIMGMPLFASAGFEFSTDFDELEDSGLSKKSIYDIIVVLMNWLLSLITIFAVIGFIVSGIYFITAKGTGKLEEAKSWLTYSIVGITVALIGYIIVQLIDNLLRKNV